MICGAVLLGSSCSTPAVEVTEVLNHGVCKTLDKGISRVQFGDLAKIRGSQLLTPGEPAAVDAELEVSDVLLVAVSNGSQPTPGYGFELQSVGGNIEEVRLEYRWLKPAPEAVMAQMITSPCSVVRLHSEQPPQAVSAWLDGNPLGTLDLSE
jgi:hypothetical protein